MRVTASSMRATGIAPLSTWAIVLVMNAFQSLGTITTSIPALIAWGQLALVHPATWPMPFQSETTTPSKPIFCLRMSLTARLLPCSLPSAIPSSALVQLLNETITLWAPAARAP